ncbi:MAG: DNA polymerase I [Gammaproteobacteria bacterium]|nr:DNA polymerase I [Gammaproteobacteria bacterium]MCP5138192.1 DNA polymerase I [Gammaproteobacteria bacterium]
MSDIKPFILIDGASYLFRAFHALPPLTNVHGEPTGAIFGVANMLRRMLDEDRPEHIAFVFDAKGPTFRNEMYPDYKANRPPMPQELAVQIEPLLTLVRAMGLPVVMESGVEADDVIGTLARQASAEGRHTLISTGDKDIAQLVDEHVTLINTMTNTRMDRDGVRAKFGVPPERIVDYLALIGDSVDNVPGVPKVGPKTAVKWLDQYDSLDAIMAAADAFTGKIGENLRASLEWLPMARELVTIKCDVPLDRTPEQLNLAPADTDTLKTLLARFEFTTWLAQIEAGSDSSTAPIVAAPVPDAAPEYDIVLSADQLHHWMARLEEAELFAFDTETTSLDYMQARIVGCSFAVEAGKAAYVPLAHDYPGAPEQLDLQVVLARLKPLLEDPKKLKVGQNLKYDMAVLANHGIALAGIAFDTMLESYVADSTGSRHDMDSLAEKYLGKQTIHFEDIAGKGAKQLRFNDIAIDDAGPYAAEDADITLRLHQALWPRVAAQEGTKSVFENIELPLIPVLSRMERGGVLIDVAQLKRQSTEMAKRILQLEKQAHEAAGQPFNLGSPKQLQEILYGKLGIEVIKKTPKGQPSTAEEVLEQLAETHALPRLILDWRGLSKLKSTYTDRLPEQLNPDTGRVHTSYHQAVAATGRLSSSDPNLQNIPVRSEEGRRIRQAFIAPPGQIVMAADYSQIELRIMAHLSGDAGLLDAFAHGADIHRATAAEVFGRNPDDVSSNERRAAKAINFGLIYGMSAFGLSRQLGIEPKEAQKYVDLYFERYPGVKDFMERTRKQAREQGFVETVFGRRLYLPEINSSNVPRRQGAERAAINAPMQGTAADIIKRAMIAVDAWIEKKSPPLRMVMQVHDELVFEVDAGFADQAEKQIVKLMAGAAELAVPLVVDVGRGINWDEAH